MEISSYTRDVEVTQQEGNREFPWQLCSNPSDVTGQVLFLFGGCFFFFFLRVTIQAKFLKQSQSQTEILKNISNLCSGLSDNIGPLLVLA